MLRSNIRQILRVRLWLSERLHPGESIVALFWAGLVGFVGALSSVLFREAIHGVQWILTGHHEGLVQTALELPWQYRLLIPVIGGLGSGLILYWGTKFTSRAPDYMEAVGVGDGVIRSRSTLVKSASSLLTIASGGSIGREGSMVQLSAMLASLVGRKASFTSPRLRLLSACGAAAGIASAYNAPIAGALFVAEIVYGSIAMETLGPLVLSSVVATVTVHQLLSSGPAFQIPAFHIASNWELLFYLALGVVAGFLSPVFLQAIDAGKSIFSRIQLPLYLKLAAGGLVVGVVSILQPEVWGNGYSVVNSILHQDWLWSALVLILITKLIATAATVGSGAVGGVFTPTLFVGATIGCLYGKIVYLFFGSHFTAWSGGYALVGMGCFLAATTQAPLMAIIMLFEMTLQYDIVLPLMLSCVAAYSVVKALDQSPIYGNLHAPKSALPAWKTLRVRDLVKKNPPWVSPISSFGKIAQVFATNRMNYVYVVNEHERFLGAVSLHDMKPYLNNDLLADSVLAIDIVKEDFPFLTPEMDLTQALHLFSTHDGERIPVIQDVENRKLMGTISKVDLLLSLSQT
ncbi:MAG: ClcB-like voltage-gated chloride channel protein [Verrucomicrobiota bacterium]